MTSFNLFSIPSLSSLKTSLAPYATSLDETALVTLAEFPQPDPLDALTQGRWQRRKGALLTKYADCL